MQPGLVCAASVALLIGAHRNQQEDVAQVKLLVEELKALSGNPSRTEFLDRPAMSKLLALGPVAYTSLRDSLLAADNWAVKASLAYVVITLARDSDALVNARLVRLLHDDHYFVRAIAISLCENVSLRYTPRNDENLAREDMALAESLNLEPSVEWMKKDEIDHLVARSLEAMSRSKPFYEPATWESANGRSPRGDVNRIMSAGLRVMALDWEISETAIQRVFMSSSAHAALGALVAVLEREGCDNEVLFGRRLRLLEIGLGHESCSSNSDRKCKDYEQYRERLFQLCERWVWSVTDPNALHAIESALTSIMSLDKAKALLERLKQQHPNLELRSMIVDHLRHFEERLTGEAKERDRQRARNDRIERENNEKYVSRREKPPYQPSRPTKPVELPLVSEPSRAGPWIVVTAVVLAVLIGGTVYYRTRS